MSGPMSRPMFRPSSRPVSRRSLAAVAVAGAALVPVAVPAAAAAPAAARAPRIIDLGTLPGDVSSVANAVNDRGVVVGHSNSADMAVPQRAFIYRNGRMTALPGDAWGADALDVNDAGVVVGWTMADDGETTAVLWRNGRLVDLGIDSSYSVATGINASGTVVGWLLVPGEGGSEMRGFSWRDGVLTILEAASGEMSRADSIDDRGRIAGVDVQETGGQPLRWVGGTPRLLADIQGTTSGSSDNGRIVGYTFGGPAFAWYEGRLTEIPKPVGAEYLQLEGINDRGEAVGYSDTGAQLWRNGAFTELPALVDTAVARDINNAGVIAGESATSQDGLVPHAVLWMR